MRSRGEWSVRDVSVDENDGEESMDVREDGEDAERERMSRDGCGLSRIWEAKRDLRALWHLEGEERSKRRSSTDWIIIVRGVDAESRSP